MVGAGVGSGTSDSRSRSKKWRLRNTGVVCNNYYYLQDRQGEALPEVPEEAAGQPRPGKEEEGGDAERPPGHEEEGRCIVLTYLQLCFVKRPPDVFVL